MANELADFDEQLDEIINEHKIKKSKEKRLLRKKESKTQNIEKINSLKYEKLIEKSNQIFEQQILKLFHDENFSDTIVECNKYFKYLHSSILIARVPILFELLKKYFIVGNDTNLIPVFKSDSTNCSTVDLNLFNNKQQYENTEFEEEQQKELETNPFIHFRLPSELTKIFNLIEFIKKIYSDENIEKDELQLISILDKIKVLEDKKLFNLENYFKLDNLISDQSMIKILNDNEQELNYKMKFDNELNNEPLYININNKNEDNQENDQHFNNLNDLIENNKQNNQEINSESIKNECIKKDKTFLLSKINLENEQFEVNILNDNDEIVNKLANIDDEINEMRNQIDSVNRLSSLDPENEEQQLITALSNEKIEIYGLVKENDDNLIYGNIKHNKETTDTVSDISEICDELSINSDIALKYSDSLNVKNLNLNDIKLNFQENNNQKEDTMDDVIDDKASLFHELINIENKVQKVVNNDENNQTYENYEDLEEDKTLSGSMVRSGTFNLQLQTPINKSIDKKVLKQEQMKIKLSESEDDSCSLKIETDSLMSNINDKNDNLNKIDSVSKTLNQNSNKDQSSENRPKMFQYFLDENQIIKKQKEINEMEQSFTNTSKQSSGLFFIDLDDTRLNSSMSKSSTFDRKKNKLKSNLNESNEMSSLNSSFTSDQQNKEEEIKTNQSKHIKSKNIDLLPMSMIVKKENINEQLSRSFIESNQGIFRLGNHYKTLSGTSLTNSASRPNSNRTSSSTLRSNISNKTKSEIHHHNQSSAIANQKTEDNEFFIKKSQYSISKLGEDFLKLFINQINCDFTIYVADKTQQLKAHKCLLSARSEYFAKKFFDNLECNTLNLIDFSYDSVHFVLCHIYSGTINIPNFNDEERTQSINKNNLNSYNNVIYREYTELNLVELLSLSDLFQLNILKDVILFEIKRNYCHHFHLPCNDCVSGVINCLHLAQKCEIPSLYNPCINWVSRHFKKVWPTKEFATLFTQTLNSPRNTPTKNSKFRNQPVHKNNEIIYNIYQAVLDNLTNDNVIDRILNFQQLASSMNRYKWNEMILQLIDELIEDCCKYLAKNYDEIVANQSFIQLGKDKTWQLEILEKYLIRSIDLMKSEIACRTYIQLENIIMMCESINENNNLNTNLDNLGIKLRKLKEGDDYPIYANTFNKNQFTDEFISTVQKLYKNIERFLIHNANEAVYCQSWNNLSKQTQDHIKKTAVLVFEFEKPLAKRPVLSSSKSRQSSAEKQQYNSNVKRKNVNSAPSAISKKSNAEDKLSDQSRQSTLTRQSAKELKNLKDKILKNMGQDEEIIDDIHIYDEVQADEIKEKIIPNVEYSKPIKKQAKKQNSNVAKVTPFSILPSDLSLSNITTTNLLTNTDNNYENYEELDDENVENNYENIIYSESGNNIKKVGSESSLASCCLQESENLQQELTKKVQKSSTKKTKSTTTQQTQNKNTQVQQSSSSSSQTTTTSTIITSNGSPQLHTSLRSRNRQQSINSVNSNNLNANRPTVKQSSRKKPPFK